MCASDFLFFSTCELWSYGYTFPTGMPEPLCLVLEFFYLLILCRWLVFMGVLLLSLFIYFFKLLLFIYLLLLLFWEGVGAVLHLSAQKF